MAREDSVARLKFLPQPLLDEWTDLGGAEVEGHTLILPVEKAAFDLAPAVRFVTLVDGADEQSLVGRVKTEAHIRELGGEIVNDSCILGDAAFEVEQGFLARPVEMPEEARATTDKHPDAGEDEAALLGKLLLDRLA